MCIRSRDYVALLQESEYGAWCVGRGEGIGGCLLQHVQGAGAGGSRSSGYGTWRYVSCAAAECLLYSASPLPLGCCLRLLYHLTMLIACMGPLLVPPPFEARSAATTTTTTPPTHPGDVAHNTGSVSY